MPTHTEVKVEKLEEKTYKIWALTVAAAHGKGRLNRRAGEKLDSLAATVGIIAG